jgi:hypothetical protein
MASKDDHSTLLPLIQIRNGERALKNTQSIFILPKLAMQSSQYMKTDDQIQTGGLSISMMSFFALLIFHNTDAILQSFHWVLSRGMSFSNLNEVRTHIVVYGWSFILHVSI